MSFSIGIVGLPNVGKSTLFKALTKKQIDIANYPFCTIEPNVGCVKVPDERLDKLTIFSKSEKTIATTINFVDIAGLVKGAHKGEGLGNQFLANIREADAICHVVRHFTKGDIIHVEGKVDPVSDFEVIKIELVFADLATIDKHIRTVEKSLKSTKQNQGKDERATLETLQKIKMALEEGIPINKQGLSEKEAESISHLDLLTAKPYLIVLNVDEDDLKKDIEIPEFKDETVIKICAQLEADLADMPSEEVDLYLKEIGEANTGLDKIIVAAYELLNLITFLTTGPDETRAWTITKGTLAPQAAGKIHTDFERGFIAAEVINWQELLDAGSEAAAKEKGLLRLEGKVYEVKDGDVCVFRFNV
ncbi:MAG TPA: redox-regulated ATPase YchF [Candidatus Bipolaricaulota bacterium]|nr:redox-regulated ATPase YchF [Candidatus Bipolaricaulota bacterium]